MRLYHITTSIAARQAAIDGQYTPERFAAEGFIHCSYVRQVYSVANRLFRGGKDLVLFEIEPSRLNCRIVDENLEGGEELFPHIYGPLDMAAVVGIRPFPCDSSGSFGNSGDWLMAPHPPRLAAGASDPRWKMSLSQDAVRCVVNGEFNKAVLHFRDGSYLQFEHTSRENRWAKSSSPDSLGENLCRALQQFRLNAKHLQLFFEDGTDAEFLPPLSTDSGLT